MASRFPEYDLSVVKTYSIADRPSKVELAQLADPACPDSTVRAFLDSLPHVLAARDLRDVARRTADARAQGRAVVWAMGAHVLKVGLMPVLIDLMERGVVTAVAVNGAAAVHDTEIALQGRTSEDVDRALAEGTFGMAAETAGLVNDASRQARRDGLGFGESLGRILADQPYSSQSLFAAGHRLGIPITVHVALGTDIVHMHPGADGGAIGDASMRDFRILVAAMRGLSDGGVLFNVGSAVLLPEVLLKAMAVLTNAGALRDFTGVNLDFIQQYRPLTQVVRRVRTLGGDGFALTGHHEILVPLLAAAIQAAMAPAVPMEATVSRGHQKIMRRQALAREIVRRQALRQRIVFTNGVFDLMHLGHVRYLQGARGLGDCLVVGVNADSSVRALKGEKRPLTPELERARMLAALETVDYVTIFDEPTPEPLIRVLKPDIHVKGGDYRPEDLPEAAAVREYGGEVRIMPFLPGRSTTGLIEEIVKRYGGD